MSSLPPKGGIFHRIVFTVRAAPVVSRADGRFAAQIRSDNRIAASDGIAGDNPLPLLSADDAHSGSLWSHINVGNSALAVAWTQAVA